MASIRGHGRHTMQRWALAILAGALTGTTSLADVRQATADNFVIEHRYEIKVPPAQTWLVLQHPERWWPADHTWSGSAANLSLSTDAGGCFCERWPEGSAEHGRVVMSRPGELLRLHAALGPLQEMGVTGVLTITLSAKDSGSEAVVTYRVTGDSSHALDKLAPIVNEVLGMQFGNFAAHASRATDG